MSPNEDGIKKGEVCPYCLNKTEYVDSSVVGKKNHGMIYLCKPCGAYVGVHKGTNEALGRLANAELREAKMETHYWFDQIARTSVINDVWPVFIKGVSNRSKSYIWLSKHLGIQKGDCHIGMFDVDMCKRATEISKKALENYGYGMPTRPPEIDQDFFK